jgi:hypothetical protein
MVDAAVCFEREVLIEYVSLEEVTSYCIEALKEMRLRIEKEESAGGREDNDFRKRRRVSATHIESIAVSFQFGRIREIGSTIWTTRSNLAQ